MPFTWRININKTANGYAYDPSALGQVETGDQIIWTNNDDRPHWPALVSGEIKKSYFMANQIAPNSPSDTFVPGVNGTFTYVDYLDQKGPQGTITVGGTNV